MRSGHFSLPHPADACHIRTMSPFSPDEWLAELRNENPAHAAQLETLLGREAMIEEDGFLSERQASELPRISTLAGQTFGAYLIERPLGHGGMGSVWLARRNDGRFEGVAAIKFLSLAVAGPAGEARFRREGSAKLKPAPCAIGPSAPANL